MREILKKLYETNNLDLNELTFLIENVDEATITDIKEKAKELNQKIYGNKIYIRALLEFSNYCRKNCMYCGLRKDNENVDRFRLDKNQIVDSIGKAYDFGYRSFVMQSGEDEYYTKDILSDIIFTLKEKFEGIAITLSIGERKFEEYEAFKKAGADRFLLRHETANEKQYEKLHPGMSFEERVRCLHDLKSLGYQVGAGFLVGLPKTSSQIMVENLRFLKELQPHMVGIGPLIIHNDTPLKNFSNGSVEDTFFYLAITRLLLPKAMLPVTTAVNTLDKNGLERGIHSGGNVLMLNLSPQEVKQKYELYKNRETKSVYDLDKVAERLENLGYEAYIGRGDHIDWSI
ncbi:[FeFe] hydrogenase H-cluster radical SAM maturase HydE [Soehngenia saccharolytica]|nr:[FeFe] hydrogenase H-cluster radical SAM maturase HydE [Soehngenia saccharolytica]